jgi:hypothetical protein
VCLPRGGSSRALGKTEAMNATADVLGDGGDVEMMPGDEGE